MPYTTLPMFTIKFGNKKVDLHSIDLKEMPFSMVVAPEFLATIATHDKPFIRAIAAEHMNTPDNVLIDLLYDSSPIVYFAAIENPKTPFEAVFLRWHKLMPETDLSQSPAKVGREQDFLDMLARYNVSENDLNNLPMSWMVALLSGNKSKTVLK